MAYSIFGSSPVIFVRISVLLKIESDRAFEVDVSMSDWRDVFQVAFRPVPVGVSSCLIELKGIPMDAELLHSTAQTALHHPP